MAYRVQNLDRFLYFRLTGFRLSEFDSILGIWQRLNWSKPSFTYIHVSALPIKHYHLAQLVYDLLTGHSSSPTAAPFPLPLMHSTRDMSSLDETIKKVIENTVVQMYINFIKS